MSKAFVRENADAPSEILPDREISAHANLVTREGLAQIDATIAQLQKQCAGTDTPRGDSPALERELRYWTTQRAWAQLVSDTDTLQVRFGARVTVERSDGRTETFRIVGIDEADPKHGTLSYLSPLAQALLGHEVGDTVKVGPTRRTILKIE
jgi:transcription elongation GreA/GreB family factor